MLLSNPYPLPFTPYPCPYLSLSLLMINGITTTGGAKGVGESTTAAVVTALISIFVTNSFLSWLMLQNASNPLS